MNLGEWRELTKDLPDDTDLVMDTEVEFEWAEVFVRCQLPPVLNHPWVVILNAGQVINYELDLDVRFDVHIGYDPEDEGNK